MPLSSKREKGAQMTSKDRSGNYFEDFHVGLVITHGTPRTLTEGDASTYISLTGARTLSHSADTAAKLLGFARRPLDDMLVFNMAFGRTVPDISLNAVANLGYADIRFIEHVYAGDTIRCDSVVIGLKENSNRRSGVVYVKSSCYDQNERCVLTWVRWVMIKKRAEGGPDVEPTVPWLKDYVPPEELSVHLQICSSDEVDEWSNMSCSTDLWDDYKKGERIDHPLGMTLEEADHMSATRLYQNNSRPHFDALLMQDEPMGRRLVYGGHVISVCKALSYDGLENALSVVAINGGRHVAPTMAGDTLYAFSEVIDKWKLPGRRDIAALRLRLVGLKNLPPCKIDSSEVNPASGKYHPSVVLDFDYTVLVPCSQK
jgi:2-methylfumaryl-CoA hydratase